MDTLYQKNLDFSHLDQRIFYKDRTIPTSKFTPFTRQKCQFLNKNRFGGNIHMDKLKGNISHTDRNVQQNNYLSRRILDYDAI